MKNALYLLLMSLFVLAGCNNQSLESTEQSVSRTHQVKISLGDDFSSRSHRYKGNYDDVSNGGSVVLYYAFQSADNTTVELSSNMSPSGGNWTVDLTLATGEYTFRAEAFNSGKVKIFDTDTARTFQITTATTNLSLGLQLNPILEDVSGTPMPIITQLSKPSGYFPGTKMKIGFTVKGGHDDQLNFFTNTVIPAPDNSSDAQNVNNYSNSTDLSPSISDNFSTYQDNITLDIPADATGPLTVVFGVDSETLQSGSYLQFKVDQAVGVKSDNSTLVFVPTVDKFKLTFNADESSSNSLKYSFEIEGNQGFNDNVSFQFDGNASAFATVTPDNSSNYGSNERAGILYRSVLSPGKLKITFTKNGGQFSYSYEYDVPGGSTTEVNTYIPSPPHEHHPVATEFDDYMVSTLAGQAGVGGSADGQGTAASFHIPSGIAVDSSDNLYVVDNHNHLIRKIDPSGTVTTLAGQAGVGGSADGQGTAASFHFPFAIAVDSSDNLYVAEQRNHLIRKIDPNGNVTTIAGQVGVTGSADGQGTAASFDIPYDIAVDSSGNLYVADSHNHLIRKLTGVTINADDDSLNWENSSGGGHDDSSGHGSGGSWGDSNIDNVTVPDIGPFEFLAAEEVTNVPLLQVLIAEFELHTLSHLIEQGENFVFHFDSSNTKGSLIVHNDSNGEFTYKAPNALGADGFSYYIMDSNGQKSNLGTLNIEVVDEYSPNNHESPSKPVAQVAHGSIDHDGSFIPADWAEPEIMFDGYKIGSSFDAAQLVLLDNMSLEIFAIENKYKVPGDDSIYFDNITIHMHHSDGYSHTVYDGPSNLFPGWPELKDSLHAMQEAPTDSLIIDFARDGSEERYYCQYILFGQSFSNMTTREEREGVWDSHCQTPDNSAMESDFDDDSPPYDHHPVAIEFDNYTVSTLAGQAGVVGSDDGQRTAASFSNPNGVAVDSSGNIYVGDALNHLIRKIDPSGNVTTLAGQAGVSGATDGQGNAASFYKPNGVAVDSFGNVYVADHLNHLIRKIGPSGDVTTLAGQVGVPGSNDGQGNAASFNNPSSSLALDSSGNVYVTDQANHLIRKIDSSGNVTTLAGQAGVVGSDDGQGTDASFNNPNGVAIDSSGNIYVADRDNHLIRKIDSSGNVITLAGQARVSGAADGQGTAASFNKPSGIAVDSFGNVYVADIFNHLIRKVDPFGNVTTLAGQAGVSGAADGQGADASFQRPGVVAVDSSGNVYVADRLNQLIRKLTGVVDTETTPNNSQQIPDTPEVSRILLPQIEAGRGNSHHTCALLVDNTVKCWGYNNYGQLGDGTVTPRYTPVSVSGIDNATAISSGLIHTCALLSNNTLKCWGNNGKGQLGDGTTTDRATPDSVSDIDNATAISSGAKHNCAVLSDNTVQCWGGNSHGQLGDGTTTDRHTPVSVQF